VHPSTGFYEDYFTTFRMFRLGLDTRYDFHTAPVGKNEMKLKRAVISVCTWVFSVALAAAGQSIAAERPLQTSPDTSVVDKGIKEKLESANPEAGPPSPSKASPSRSHSRTHQRYRSHRHRSSQASEQPLEVPMAVVIVSYASASATCNRSYYARLVEMQR
jgi:hypothetical protein